MKLLWRFQSVPLPFSCVKYKIIATPYLLAGRLPTLNLLSNGNKDHFLLEFSS